MPDAYSYFKAEGESLRIVQTVAAANEAWEALVKAVEQKLNTMISMRSGMQPSFLFHAGDALPGDWVVEETIEDHATKKPKYFFMYPAPGSDDAAFMDDVKKQMDELRPNLKLEPLFGSGHMPMRALPAGKYSNSFVARVKLTDPNFGGYSSQPKNWKEHGRLTEHLTVVFSSNSAIRASDPLDYMKYGDDYYIRVPNDPNGKMYFVPPQSDVFSFEEMIELDIAEHEKRTAAARPAGMSPS